MTYNKPRNLTLLPAYSDLKVRTQYCFLANHQQNSIIAIYNTIDLAVKINNHKKQHKPLSYHKNIYIC